MDSPKPRVFSKLCSSQRIIFVWLLNSIVAMLQNNEYMQFIGYNLLNLCTGHGFSSKYPDGMSYKASDALVVLKRMHRHFGWQDGSMALVGHSMGAGVASMFAVRITGFLFVHFFVGACRPDPPVI